MEPWQTAQTDQAKAALRELGDMIGEMYARMLGDVWTCLRGVRNDMMEAGWSEQERITVLVELSEAGVATHELLVDRMINNG